MAKSLKERFAKDSPWRAIVFAVALLVVGELFLAWQYQNLNRGRLAEVEQKLAEQEQVIEERAAQDALIEFLDARVEGDERRLIRYITENTMQQREQDAFTAYGIEDYSIERKTEIEEGVFRFQVSVSRNRLQEIEFVEVIKILDQYYIDSVELAG
jgi:uncharacterized coiled-coil protein SlyX